MTESDLLILLGIQNNFLVILKQNWGILDNTYVYMCLDIYIATTAGIFVELYNIWTEIYC